MHPAIVTAPKRQPTEYTTLEKLLEATERLLASGANKIGGTSAGMWLHNAEYIAGETFGDASGIRELRSKYAVTRHQDLQAPDGGHAVFGVPLPKRSYGVGDNIPGIGVITDSVRLADGYQQFEINREWLHELVVDPQAVPQVSKPNTPQQAVLFA